MTSLGPLLQADLCKSSNQQRIYFASADGLAKVAMASSSTSHPLTGAEATSRLVRARRSYQIRLDRGAMNLGALHQGPRASNNDYLVCFQCVTVCMRINLVQLMRSYFIGYDSSIGGFQRIVTILLDTEDNAPMLEHGGGLRAAAQRYAIPLENWLDLSTGINPYGWPVCSAPAEAWRRLPEADDGLEQAAAEYFASAQVLPVAGSQAAIQVLPVLRPHSRVGVLDPSYNEHGHAWRRHGHTLMTLGFGATAAIDAVIANLDVLVLCHPNNPTGVRFTTDQLLAWQQHLARRDGWLVLDEAFMDATPEHSLSAYAGLPGLLILRSLGKFFGLAGARVGFVLGEAALRRQLAEQVGPWTINGPGRWIASQALADRSWQQQTRLRLQRDSDRLAGLLDQHELPVSGGSALFQWTRHPQAEALQDALAHRGILVRRFTDPPSLRIGLPGPESAWERLRSALTEVQAHFHFVDRVMK